ncbi:hypothetical protein OENI_1370003 [Oenococcus oeni]|nr:hypothetical protein OENI_1370003 [Oenococcus oeni]SYW12560.1 hypothetical protein OENI_320005 [Oenococcus oeni]SYW14814.1 hypothetical protein OENI_640003 [Oenococcus oeni]SYW16166.1 hypothetical protein OENI_280005 [Oenococcus oeni]SYW17324.1 hypothetical protein OENI_1010005 [Oenococcus oeni]
MIGIYWPMTGYWVSRVSLKGKDPIAWNLITTSQSGINSKTPSISNKYLIVFNI